jgi:hypothetical protein
MPGSGKLMRVLQAGCRGRSKHRPLHGKRARTAAAFYPAGCPGSDEPSDLRRRNREL